MRIIHYEAEKRYVDAGMLLCTVFFYFTGNCFPVK